jgi:hypothetical protein
MLNRVFKNYIFKSHIFKSYFLKIANPNDHKCLDAVMKKNCSFIYVCLERLFFEKMLLKLSFFIFGVHFSSKYLVQIGPSQDKIVHVQAKLSNLID